MRGLYDYHAQGSDELGIREGEMIELSGGPNGGQHYADGWWEGKLDAVYPLHSLMNYGSITRNKLAWTEGDFSK